MQYIITDTTLNLPDNKHLAEKVQSKLNELLNNQDNIISIYDLKTRQFVPYEPNFPLSLQLKGMHLEDPAKIQININQNSDVQLLDLAATRKLVGEDLTISYKTLYESGFFLLEPEAQEAILKDFPLITLNLDDLFGRQELRNKILKIESTNFINEFNTLLQQKFMKNKTIYYEEATIRTSYPLSSIVNWENLINNKEIKNNNNSLPQVKNTSNSNSSESTNSSKNTYEFNDEYDTKNTEATTFDVHIEDAPISLFEIICILKKLKNIHTFYFEFFKGFKEIYDENYCLDKNSLLFLKTIKLSVIEFHLNEKHNFEFLIAFVSQLSKAAPNLRNFTFDCVVWEGLDPDYQTLFSLLEPMKSLEKLTLRYCDQIFSTAFFNKINQLGIKSLVFDLLSFGKEKNYIYEAPKLGLGHYSSVLEIQQENQAIDDDCLYLLPAFFEYAVAHFPNLTVGCLELICKEIETVERELHPNNFTSFFVTKKAKIEEENPNLNSNNDEKTHEKSNSL